MVVVCWLLLVVVVVVVVVVGCFDNTMTRCVYPHVTPLPLTLHAFNSTGTNLEAWDRATESQIFQPLP